MDPNRLFVEFDVTHFGLKVNTTFGKYHAWPNAISLISLSDDLYVYS